MIITHETTIEEYEAWLATKPEFSEFKKAVRATVRAVSKTVFRISKLFKRVRKSKSRLRTARTLYPLSYDKNGGIKGYESWVSGISKQVRETKRHLALLSMFDVIEGKVWAADIFEQKQKRIARIEDEIGMECQLAEALRILIKK